MIEMGWLRIDYATIIDPSKHRKLSVKGSKVKLKYIVVY